MGQYIRQATHSLEEILPIILRCWKKEIAKSLIPSGYIVGVSSVRLKLFAQAKNHGGLHCKACGLKATHFAVERFEGSRLPSTHLNLYGVRGEIEVLFTKDHKVPKSKGGSNGLNNMQVMCQPCNSLKGSRNSREFLQWRQGHKQKAKYDALSMA
jgi:hypothetical protein